MRRLIHVVALLVGLWGVPTAVLAQPKDLKRRPPRDVARLSFVSPAVRTQVPGQREWYEALPDQPTERNTRVATGTQGGAEIAIGEQLRIQLEPESSLLVRKLPRGARGPGDIQLQKGTLQVEIIDGKNIGPLKIATPIGDLRVQGANVRVVVDEKGQTAIAVHQGQIALKTGRNQLTLIAGMGTVLRPGDDDLRIRQLPVAPTWLDGGDGGRARIALSSGSLRGAGRQAELFLNFTTVPGAVRYRVEVASDPQLHDRRVLSDIPGSPLRAELLPGLYYARVSAMDGELLAGPASPIQTLYLIAVRSNATVVATPAPSRSSGAKNILQLQRAQSAILKFDTGTLPLGLDIAGQRRETCRGECVYNLGPGTHPVALSLNDSDAQLAVAVSGGPQPPSPPPPSPPPAVAERVEAIDVGPALWAPGLPLRTVDPRTRLYALLGVGAHSPVHQLDVVRLDLGAEWAFLRRRLSLDLNVPLLYFIDFPSATNVPRSGPALGDMAVGARALALQAAGGRLHLGALLRLQLPTGTYERGAVPLRPLTIDPALGLSVLLGRFGLLTTQGITASLNVPQAELRYSMGYAAQVRVSRLALVAQAEAALALYGPIGHAAAVGGGLRLRLDSVGHFRLLAAARGALGGASEAVFGRYSAQLGIEWVRF